MLGLLSSRADLDREARVRDETRAKTRHHVVEAIKAASVPGGCPNMVSAMSQAEDARHGKLSDKEIEEEFITLRGAGHETTSNTVSWVLLLLAQDPDAQKRVHDEVERYENESRQQTHVHGFVHVLTGCSTSYAHQWCNHRPTWQDGCRTSYAHQWCTRGAQQRPTVLEHNHRPTWQDNDLIDSAAEHCFRVLVLLPLVLTSPCMCVASMPFAML